MNSLENEVQQLLKESGMSEKKIIEFENMEMKDMDPEEVRKRRAELAQLRSLSFFYERKMKRIGKIKSKKYHLVSIFSCLGVHVSPPTP